MRASRQTVNIEIERLAILKERETAAHPFKEVLNHFDFKDPSHRNAWVLLHVACSTFRWLLVLARGRLSPSIPASEATVEQLGAWMSGLWDLSPLDAAAEVQA